MPNRRPPPCPAAEQGERQARLCCWRTGGEWLKTFARPFSIDRAEDDDDSLQDAAAAAEQFDTPTLQADARAARSRVRFDLDLPANPQTTSPSTPPLAASGCPSGTPAEPRSCLRACKRDASRPAWAKPLCVATRAARLAQQLRRRLALQQVPCAGGVANAMARRSTSMPGCATPRCRWAWLPFTNASNARARPGHLLLADLSVSTDSYADSDRRVIEVIRDSLYTFGEALSGSGDAFALLGFSSLQRQLRLHELKTFDERWGPRVHAGWGPCSRLLPASAPRCEQPPCGCRAVRNASACCCS